MQELGATGTEARADFLAENLEKMIESCLQEAQPLNLGRLVGVFSKFGIKCFAKVHVVASGRRSQWLQLAWALSIARKQQLEFRAGGMTPGCEQKSPCLVEST